MTSTLPTEILAVLYDMMFTYTARKPGKLDETRTSARKSGPLLSRKIWLPKAVYATLPYFYLTTGFVALMATLYISHWLWILPHYLLFSAACLHMGVLIYRRRHGSPEDSN